MKICKGILCIFTLVFLVLCGILSLTQKDKEFSEAENRYLAQLPEFKVKELLSGEYQSDMQEYLADQVVYRDGFMQLYALTQKLMGKSEYNGVYLCEDNYLIEAYAEPEKTESITQKFSSVAENTDAECILMLVPTAISIYEDKLPGSAGKNNEQAEVRDYIYANAGMETVDVWSALEESKDDIQLFYRTDHHWTTEAAYIAYLEFCESRGFEPKEKSYYEITTISDEFYGTIYSKALTPFQPADSISVYKQDMSGITVTYSTGEGELYNEEYLSKKDKYSYFLNGNQAKITINNENVDNGRVLLVVKDSYANCFVPFLINHYESIVVLDTRYYRNGVTTTAADIGATEILFLFNLNTMDSDVAMAGIY